eukprot:8070719-Alexandrium_andersonii.AAC.1
MSWVPCSPGPTRHRHEHVDGEVPRAVSISHVWFGSSSFEQTSEDQSASMPVALPRPRWLRSRRHC